MMNRRAFLATVGASIAAAPLVSEAQQAGKMYRLGWIGFAPPTTDDAVAIMNAFLQELRAHGFVEGQNVRIERRYSEGREEPSAASAAEFVSTKVDLIVATNSVAARAAKEATSTIPIVLTNVSDPERQGLVGSLARPGGNVTGTSSVGIESSAKLLQIAKESLPQASALAILWNPDNAASARGLTETDVPTATALGMALTALEVRSAADLERALDTIIRKRVDVLYSHLALFPHRLRIQDFAMKQRLPVVTGMREWTRIGGLISYGPDLRDLYRRSAIYVVKILKGANPADLPVEQPTRFDLVVNLKTAKALGLTIPPSLLGRADEVIQ